MDIRKVKKLIELLQETGIGEIEIHEDKESVRISRYSPASAQQMPYTVHAPVVGSPPPAHTASALPAGETAIAAPPPTRPPEGHIVKSPMVGTVYLASAPGEKPFVEVGKTVKIGDVLCVIEAMKMFNQIEADKAGVLSARLIENGNPVEYDQSLFIIEA
jgi:acetyl-CoA carboxylase biotin carboxyl carrier protein